MLAQAHGDALATPERPVAWKGLTAAAALVGRSESPASW